MPNVRVIAPTIKRNEDPVSGAVHRRKVAGYARVSTDKDEQFTSYAAQIDYYTSYIKAHSDWEFVDVYTDEGITGTSTKRRSGFRQMIADALAGKIDLIITKSVSRFARNTVDSLTTIRKLKEKGIECYFEKENIWTLDAKGELLITIMSSLAQEESRSISGNVTWGMRQCMAKGKVTVPFSSFLGYDRGADGGLVIDPEQAVTVRRIYGMFMQGMMPSEIGRQLEREGIPSPTGKKQWFQTTVTSILTNEKYKGDALLQKTYTEDFLTKRKIKNQGEVQQYYVTESHEPIISPDFFDMVQEEMALRQPPKLTFMEGNSLFTTRVRCGRCDVCYGAKNWNSKLPSKKTVWMCNARYKKNINPDGCPTPILSEDDLKSIYVEGIKVFLAEGERNADDFVSQSLRMISGLEAEYGEWEKELIAIDDKRVSACDEENAILDYRLELAEERMEQIKAEISDHREKISEITELIKNIAPNRLEFSEKLWNYLADHMTVYADNDYGVTLKNGIEYRIQK